jgi:hypothetical protein
LKKFRGVFTKYGGWEFLEFLDSWNRSMAGGPRPRRLGLRVGLGQNSHRELALYRGKSCELVAEADSSLSLSKISTESQRSELD